jgi:hypothetical protein
MKLKSRGKEENKNLQKILYPIEERGYANYAKIFFKNN